MSPDVVVVGGGAIGASAALELLAERPNELWSWDISKLLGPTT